MKSTSKRRTPSIVNLTVKRRYLTARGVERLTGLRPQPLPLWASRRDHDPGRLSPLRASEVCDLQWQQIELSEGRLHVHRGEERNPQRASNPRDEMRALRKLRRDYPKDAYVFASERGGPIIAPIGFHRLIQRVGEAANRPHMPRHACGF